MLLKKRLKYYPTNFSKLSKIRFDINGNIIKKGRAWKFASKHFPALLKRFEEIKGGNTCEELYRELRK